MSRFYFLILSLILVSSSAFSFDKCLPISEETCYALDGYYENERCCLADQKAQDVAQVMEIIFVNPEADVPRFCDHGIKPWFCLANGGYPVGSLCCYDM